LAIIHREVRVTVLHNVTRCIIWYIVEKQQFNSKPVVLLYSPTAGSCDGGESSGGPGRGNV